MHNEYIDYEYLGSLKRRHMSQSERAAQFAPFAALAGYEDAINEEKRETGRKIEISEEEKREIDNKLRYLLSNKESKAIVEYFVKDSKKEGGCYKTIEERIIKADLINGTITFESKIKINVADILKISI